MGASADRGRGQAGRGAGGLFVLGVAATASQVLILRELLVAFQGNELLLGLFLGNWLLLEAAGVLLARGAADRGARPERGFALLQAGLGLAPLGGLILVRSFKASLGISTGEILPLGWAWVVSAAALAPAAVADGAAFPFGCRVLADRAGSARAAGRAYAWSAAGAVLGGALFLAPPIQALSPLLLACLLGAACAASAGLILSGSGAGAGCRRANLGLAAGLLLAAGAGWPERLEAWSVGLQWHDQALVATARSPHGHLAVVRAAEQTTIFVNGSPVVAVPHPGPEVELLAHVPLLLHQRPRRVLVLGGGAGGLLREILKHPVEAVVYAEQDPMLLELLRRFPTPLTTSELTHPAVRTHPVEGRLLLRTMAGGWDVILLHLPPPDTLRLNRYYSREFFDLARRRLAPGGILALALPGSESFLAPELVALNGSVHAALRGAFSSVRVLPGESTLFVASDGAGRAGAWTPEILGGRLAARGIRAGLVSADYLAYRMDPGRFAALAEAIQAERTANRDALPRGTLAGMRRYARIVSPPTARLLAWADGIPAAALGVGIGGAVGGLGWLQWRRRRPYYLGYAAASTGMAGMVMSVALVLAFQIQHGDVYQYLGLLAALFMLGGAAGSAWGARRGPGPLLAVEGGLLLVLLAAAACARLGPPPAVWLAAIVLLMTLTGAVTGAQYPLLVARAHASTGGPARPAGRIYALDLAGAVAGAILTGIVLLPTLGLAVTLLLAAALKAGSLLLILAWRLAGAGHPPGCLSAGR